MNLKNQDLHTLSNTKTISERKVEDKFAAIFRLGEVSINNMIKKHFKYREIDTKKVIIYCSISLTF